MSYFKGNEPDCMYTYPSLDRKGDSYESLTLEPDYYLDITPEDRERVAKSLQKLFKKWKKEGENI